MEHTEVITMRRLACLLDYDSMGNAVSAVARVAVLLVVVFHQ